MPRTVAEYGVDVSPTADFASLRAAGVLGSREEVEAELDDIMAAMRTFHSQEPDQVLMQVMAYGARLTELYLLLHRAEAHERGYQRIRTQQVDRLLHELDRQGKIASRLIEVRRQDMELLR